VILAKKIRKQGKIIEKSSQKCDILRKSLSIFVEEKKTGNSKQNLPQKLQAIPFNLLSYLHRFEFFP
jgi:hypothetical protein